MGERGTEIVTITKFCNIPVVFYVEKKTVNLCAAKNILSIEA